MNLRKEKVPAEITTLLPMVEKWGINDDYKREKKVSNASDEELVKLVKCLDGFDESILFDWLEGPESYDVNPSEEYIAFTCFTMAIDSAKIKIKDRGLL